jgi:hydrogenase expression/formation protein HypC
MLNFASQTIVVMCLSLPGKILSIDSSSELKMAEVDFGGVKREVCVEWVPEAQVGDYVLAHVGTALTVLDEESARESIEALTELSKVLEEEERNRPLNLPK